MSSVHGLTFWSGHLRGGKEEPGHRSNAGQHCAPVSAEDSHQGTPLSAAKNESLRWGRYQQWEDAGLRGGTGRLLTEQVEILVYLLGDYFCSHSLCLFSFYLFIFFGCSSENTFLDLSVLKFWSELVVGRSREIMEMPELRWHFHKPYEFLRKKQCPQLDLKWGFLCGCSYSRYTVGGYYFIFCKRCQCKTTLI